MAARLIVKSPYIKGGRGGGAQGYLKYIGTRENVELLPDDRPPTQRQSRLIAKLAKDFPGMTAAPAYAAYVSNPTRAKASALISDILEQHWEEVQQSQVYLRYIATRPRAERMGNHGLFSDEASVDLRAAMSELERYTGNVWTHIISLRREDAVRYGYDHAEAWRNLLLTHRNEIAAAMHIPPKNFRWYAAFHNEGDHPHVHMMAWSVQPGEAYLAQDGIRKIRSALTGDVFRYELSEVLEQKSASRNELVQEARAALRELTAQMRMGICNCPETEQRMEALSSELASLGGKNTYGYLPKRLKKQVDVIVDELERLPVVAEAYDRWLELQRLVDGYYKDEERPRRKLSEEKEFRAIKNAVIREAELIWQGIPTFEDEDLDREDERRESFADADEDSVQALEELAEQGNAEAQYRLGQLYRDGPTPIPDWVEARYYLEQAADQGLTDAQYALGKLLLTEDVEVQDPEQGIQWLEYAAENGHSYAAYRAGKEYLRGAAVEKDEEKARQFFRRSADLGNPYGQYMLGKLCLAEGDLTQGLSWMRRSAERGNDFAQFFLDRQNSLSAPSGMLSVTRLLYHMSRVLRDNTPQPPGAQGIRMDRKRFQELAEEKGYDAALNYARETEEDGSQTMRTPW